MARARAGTPFIFDEPQTTPGGAEPLATESTLAKAAALHRGAPATLLQIVRKLNTLAEILQNSAIARHSDSLLEKSLDNIKDSTVSFNEKTLRWHDDQSNLMVKGTDPRVAEAMKVKENEIPF